MAMGVVSQEGRGGHVMTTRKPLWRWSLDVSSAVIRDVGTDCPGLWEGQKTGARAIQQTAYHVPTGKQYMLGTWTRG